MRINMFFAWYDLWIGVYIDRGSKAVYICPLPMLVIKITTLGTSMRLKKIANRWHLILHKSLAFGRGRYPDKRFIVFDYFDVGPLQIRRYVYEDWNFSLDKK